MDRRIRLNYQDNLIAASSIIDSNIEKLAKVDLGLCASNILSHIRNLLDAIVKIVYTTDCNEEHDNELALLRAAKKYCFNKKEFEEICSFYNFIDIVSSHITQNEFCSLSLISKYADYLFEVKEYCLKKFNIVVLKNLMFFPFDEIATERHDFYKAIYEGLKVNKNLLLGRNIFYIEKKKRIYIGNDLIYEYVLAPVVDEESKFDRLTVYYGKNIKTTHSISCQLSCLEIDILGGNAKVFYIDDYCVEIMPREINKFSKLCNKRVITKSNYDGYQLLMNYLTNFDTSLFELITCKTFEQKIFDIFGGKSNIFSDVLLNVHEVLNKTDIIGSKTIKYILFVFKYSLMKRVEFQGQYDSQLNSDFPFLSSSCLPFEKDPFCFGLRKTNPCVADLLSCLGDCCCRPSLLKRNIKNSIEIDKILYSPIDSFGVKDYVLENVHLYNSSLDEYFKKRGEEILVIFDKYLTIKKYEDDVAFILNKIKHYSAMGNDDYLIKANTYLSTLKNGDIDDDKMNFLKKGFLKTSVLIVNGSAGTGKTTLVKHLISILNRSKFLLLSATHSALQNLRRRVRIVTSIQNSYFSTLDSAERIVDIDSYDCLIIDECSTASNDLVAKILAKGKFKYLVLVGDETQIQAINFGNWFSLAINCFQNISNNLTIVHRGTDKNLLTLWELTRTKSSDLFEKMIVYPNLVKPLNNIFLDKKQQDEAVLCLNYDGPYGVNNINRYMQEKNDNDAISWSVWAFKKGDPILFNGCRKFSRYFYNNQKGFIHDIVDNEKYISVIVGVEYAETNPTFSTASVIYRGKMENFQYYGFNIGKKAPKEENDDFSSSTVPFQLAYAVSIHKSQGLEFECVKVIITDDIDKSIDHSIFYTAITRAKSQLSIYTMSESLKSIISNFKNVDFSVDISILKNRKLI